MANPRVDMYLLYRVAKLYYDEGLTQQEIAIKECISRSQISRYLDLARTEGIVQISVRMPSNIHWDDLQNALHQTYHLANVCVVPVPDGINEQEAIDFLATGCISFLQSQLKGCRTIGLGWGRTIYRMANAMPRSLTDSHSTFVPLIGASGTDNPSLQINAIIDHMANQMRGNSCFINTPAFRPLDTTLSELEENRIARLRQYWSRLDAAVVGVGSWNKGQQSFIVSEVQDVPSSSQNAVGDILSQFYREDGSVVTFAEGYTMTAFNIGQLYRVPKVIALAASPQKATALKAAIRNKYINTLVVDSTTARALLQEDI